MAIIFRYFPELDSFRSQLRRSGWLAISRFLPRNVIKYTNYAQRTLLFFAVAKLAFCFYSDVPKYHRISLLISQKQPACTHPRLSIVHAAGKLVDDTVNVVYWWWNTYLTVINILVKVGDYTASSKTRGGLAIWAFMQMSDGPPLPSQIWAGCRCIKIVS